MDHTHALIAMDARVFRGAEVSSACSLRWVFALLLLFVCAAAAATAACLACLLACYSASSSCACVRAASFASPATSRRCPFTFDGGCLLRVLKLLARSPALDLTHSREREMEFLRRHWLPITVHSTLCLVNVLWGVFAVYSRWALQDYLPELVFSSLRFMLALPFMFMAAAIEALDWRVLLPVSWMQMAHFVVTGCLAGTSQSLYISGLARTTGMPTHVDVIL